MIRFFICSIKIIFQWTQCVSLTFFFSCFVVALFLLLLKLMIKKWTIQCTWFSTQSLPLIHFTFIDVCQSIFMLYIFVSNSKQKKKKDNNDRYEQKYASTKYVIVIFSSSCHHQCLKSLVSDLRLWILSSIAFFFSFIRVLFD